VVQELEAKLGVHIDIKTDDTLSAGGGHG